MNTAVTRRQTASAGAPKHWQLEIDREQIAWLQLQPSAPTLFSEPVLRELSRLLTELEENDTLVGLGFLLGDPGAGRSDPDLDLYRALSTAAAPIEHVRAAQGILQRLSTLRLPTVAAIHGYCTGSPLELALACRFRVASTDNTTRLGLPATEYGLHSGWGGGVRLPQLIGAWHAVRMQVKGRLVSARAARGIRLVDASVPPRHLKAASRRLATLDPPPSQPDWLGRLSNMHLARRPLARRFRNRLRERLDPELHPAPYAIVDLWEHQPDDMSKALEDEAESFVRLLQSEATHNRLRIRLLRRRLRDEARPVDLDHLHVIGSGTMGGSIAAWAALMGIHVSLEDAVPAHIGRTLQRARELFRRNTESRREVTAALDRLMPDPRGHGRMRADLVIEAIPESLEAKQALLAELEGKIRPDAIIATSSSSIPLEEIGQALRHPERLIGLHFFNPVNQLELVQVVRGAQTRADIMPTALGFVRRLERLPLTVASGAGLLVGRIQHAYLMEAMTMLDEQVKLDLIDAAAHRFGMPEGPLEMADRVGLDLCLQVAESFNRLRGDEVSHSLQTQVAAGRLGRKSGHGFYDYRHGRPVALGPAVQHTSLDELSDRLLYRLLNEAVACLREGVVADADLLDAGVVLSGNFPAFRGGPIYYVTHRGSDATLHRLRELKDYYGERFEPDPGWERLGELQEKLAR